MAIRTHDRSGAEGGASLKPKHQVASRKVGNGNCAGRKEVGERSLACDGEQSDKEALVKRAVTGISPAVPEVSYFGGNGFSMESLPGFSICSL